MSDYTTINTGTVTLGSGSVGFYGDFNGGINSKGSIISGTINTYDHPFNTIEKDNKKILQYELIGLNSNHIKVTKNFVNKTKTLFVKAEGKYEDELTGWKNEININLEVDYKVYNKVTWNVNDGILNIILHEIKNEEPNITLYNEDTMIIF